jgi:predicted outer membrane protein
VTEPEVRRSRVLTQEHNDRRILRWLAVDNNALLAWAEHAATRSKNDAVRAMATELTEDHKALADKLKPQAAQRANPIIIDRNWLRRFLSCFDTTKHENAGQK